MPEASPSEPDLNPLDTDLQVLRREVQLLRTQQAAATYGNARFQTVFENSPLGQKIIGADLVIREVNPAMVDMLGLRHANELLGHKILEFTHPDHQEKWRALQQQLWQHSTPHFTLETYLLRPDGSAFWCQVTSILFFEQDQEMGYTILEDVTARKKDETMLRQLNEAQEIVLHLATHDLRAPLATIQLLTDLLQRDLANMAPEQAQYVAPEMPHFLQLIWEASIEADRLLEEVLYLGGLTADQLAKQPVDLSQWLATQLETHYRTAQHHGITLTFTVPETPVPAEIHPAQFRRVVDNLLSNAFKFTPAHGHVTVQVLEYKGRPCVQVQDSGMGIPTELQTNLFEKFSATRREGLRGEPTTGLGLFIAQQIVRLHGGHIWLESYNQQGTCVYVEL